VDAIQWNGPEDLEAVATFTGYQLGRGMVALSGLDSPHLHLTAEDQYVWPGDWIGKRPEGFHVSRTFLDRWEPIGPGTGRCGYACSEMHTYQEGCQLSPAPPS
jgi:hypothetical protein